MLKNSGFLKVFGCFGVIVSTLAVAQSTFLEAVRSEQAGFSVVAEDFVEAASQTDKSQQVPILGSAADLYWSKTDELRLGWLAKNQLKKNAKLYESAIDEEYLNDLAAKLTTYTQTRTGVRVFLTNALTINAMAMPGGYIGINVGAVLAADDESELAGILAHEIAHVAKNHLAQTLENAKSRRLSQMATVLAALLVAQTSKAHNLGMGIVAGVSAQAQQAVLDDMRQNETEADLLGKQLLKQSGFDETAMTRFLDKITTSQSSVPSYLLTHPRKEVRQAALEPVMHSAKKRPSSVAFQLFKARIMVAFLSDEAVQQAIKTAEKTAPNGLSSRYLKALYLQKQQRFQAAEKQLLGMPLNRDVCLLRASLYENQQQNQQAIATLKSCLKAYEGDALLLRALAKQYLITKQFLAAEQTLAPLIEQAELAYLDDALLWLYGQSLAGAGKHSVLRLFLQRYYQAIGDEEAARAQAAQASATDSGGS